MAPLPVYRLLIVYPEEVVNNGVKKTLFRVLGILLLEIIWASIYGAKSAVSHGWLFARPSYSLTLKMPQAPLG